MKSGAKVIRKRGEKQIFVPLRCKIPTLLVFVDGITHIFGEFVRQVGGHPSLSSNATRPTDSVLLVMCESVQQVGKRLDGIVVMLNALESVAHISQVDFVALFHISPWGILGSSLIVSTSDRGR